MILQWNQEKNLLLKKTRGVCFEDIEIAVVEGGLVDILPSHSKKYPNQKLLIVELNSYIYYVPFVEDGEIMFLKTIIPSRNYAKKYKKRKK